MRHLIYKRFNGSLTSTSAILNPARTDYITKDLEPGTLARLIVTYTFGRLSYSLGKVIDNPVKVADGYLAKNPAHAKATTGSPGIAGYQMRADASAHAAYEALKRSNELGHWIVNNVIADTRERFVINFDTLEIEPVKTGSISTGQGYDDCRFELTEILKSKMSKARKQAGDLESKLETLNRPKKGDKS